VNAVVLEHWHERCRNLRIGLCDLCFTQKVILQLGNVASDNLGGPLLQLILVHSHLPGFEYRCHFPRSNLQEIFGINRICHCRSNFGVIWFIVLGLALGLCNLHVHIADFKLDAWGWC